MTYPKDYSPGSPRKTYSESLNKYKKYYVIISVIFAVILCYLAAERNFIVFIFGEEVLTGASYITTFPYSFMFSLLLFGFYFWFLPFLGLLKLHEHLFNDYEER